ncbi:MAG TPA: tungstate transporter permease, partial [Bacillota bacterium]|nr:tungstate transporter permease [Bacillota bacterium]
MPRLLEGILEAFTLIIRLDPELIKIVFLSLRVSGAAIIISTLLGVPLGTWLGLKPEKKTALVNKVIYTLM